MMAIELDAKLCTGIGQAYYSLLHSESPLNAMVTLLQSTTLHETALKGSVSYHMGIKK
jgi:hypothetical protein